MGVTLDRELSLHLCLLIWDTGWHVFPQGEVEGEVKSHQLALAHSRCPSTGSYHDYYSKYLHQKQTH